MRRISSALAFVATLAAAPAVAGEGCRQGRDDIDKALQHARLDDYTRRQVDGELSRIDRAMAVNSEAECEDAVEKLKHILHLDH